MDSKKQNIAAEISRRVKDGETIGVGTGTTVVAVLEYLKKRISEEGLFVKVVPTSYQSAWQAEEIGMNVLSPALAIPLDWGFDGADEIDPELRLLKGRGAAMLHEKIVAARCKEFVVVATEDKLVSKLGESMAVPVEVVPESVSYVKAALTTLGARSVVLRMAVALEREVPLFTQEGNLILDASFSEITHDREAEINAIPGVVENGIFTQFATEVVVGEEKGVRIIKKESKGD